jgi:hypothetical protein
MTRVAWSIAVAALLATRVIGGSGQTPAPRDAANAAGTGVIAGVVVTDEVSPRPVHRASVMLSSGDLRFPQAVMTDDTGRFVFAGLPAGNYTIVATKPAYVAAFFGGKRPGRGPGVPIALVDGQRVDDITLRMIHGAAITGTVRSASGSPAQSQNVQVFSLDTVNGVRRVSLGVPLATTDDRGEYRVYGLAPGDYVIQVTPSFTSQFLSGDARLVTAAELRWADQSGATPAGATSPTAPPPGQTVAYASVYYPGTPDLGSASVVTIGPGETREAVDVLMSLVPTARISGTVIDSDGQPVPGAQVAAAPAGGSTDIISVVGAVRPMSRPTRQDGTFSLTGVTPGAYTLSVRATPRSDATGRGGTPDQSLATAARLLGANVGSPTLWASADVTVDGRDLSDIVLRLQPGMTVSGRLVFEGASSQTADVSRAHVALMPPPTGSSPVEIMMTMLTGTISATIAPDGTFTVKGVLPNKYRVTTSGLGILLNQAATSGWTLKSATLGGRDVADAAFEVRPNEDVTGIVVTLTDRPSELSGIVTDRAGRPAPGFPILVFSADRRFWTVGSRRVQQARPSSDGRYKLTGLPAGEYYMCALTDLDQNQLYDPSFLESLLPGSFKISIADGEKKTQDLKLAGGG